MKIVSKISLVALSCVLVTACGNSSTEQDSEVSAAEVVEKSWPEAKTTNSGLKYLVLAEGQGGESPQTGSLVKAHYTGKLLDGTVFDSSVSRGKPLAFSVGMGQVIKGWDEAFLDMTKGEKRKLIIPPELAYGSRGVGRAIPPNATLVFDVELVDF